MSCPDKGKMRAIIVCVVLCLLLTGVAQAMGNEPAKLHLSGINKLKYLQVAESDMPEESGRSNEELQEPLAESEYETEDSNLEGRKFIDILAGSATFSSASVSATKDYFVGPDETAIEEMGVDPSPVFALRYGRWLESNRNIGLALEGSIISMSAKGKGASEASAQALILTGLILFKYEGLEGTGNRRLFVPYTGVGLSFYSGDVSATINPPFTESVDGSGSGMSLDLRLGLRAYFSGGNALLIELRYLPIDMDTADDSGFLFYPIESATFSTTATMISVGFSIAYD